jgi:hypothetical protein
MERDDLLVLIHKALRHGLFEVTRQAGATDWADAEDVAALRQRWETVAGLVRSHAGHEDRHIFALLETKQPGAVALLGIGHDRVEAELDELAARFEAAFTALDPIRGRDAYLALTRFVATALAHFADEEPAVMDRIWATCTDEEIATCRAAFMAEISPHESLATAELVIPATSLEERTHVMSAARASAPPAVFQTILDVAARTLSPSQLAALHAHLDNHAPTPVPA